MVHYDHTRNWGERKEIIYEKRTHGTPVPVWFSVAAGGNSKACWKLLKAFTEIHNSLRSDNGFLFITQLSASQEFPTCLHMKPNRNRSTVLGMTSHNVKKMAESPGIWLC